LIHDLFHSKSAFPEICGQLPVECPDESYRHKICKLIF
jgi:hypothetical protein